MIRTAAIWGGTPHGLMDVLGLRSTEIDGLFDWEENQFMPVDGNEAGAVPGVYVQISLRSGQT